MSRAVVVLAALALLLPASAHATPLQRPPELPPLTELWRCDEQALGLPFAGRLDHGVQLPVEGDNFFTWDGVLNRSPNRSWRRWGTRYTLETLMLVLGLYAEEEPLAARVAIQDISRRPGGIFDERFGGLGHASHQNGLDVDIAYPRLDGLELGIDSPLEVDVERSQLLVDLFVKAGATRIYVGPRLPLRGPRGIVTKLRYHDDHMHVRLRCPTDRRSLPSVGE